ncbi:MAG: DUF423 domain-containing protein [Flavobacteriaceae bacterium]
MNQNYRDFLSLGVLFVLVGIVGGAFGAHALEPYLQPDALDAYHTACDYWWYQGFSLVLLSSVPLFQSLEIKTPLRMLACGGGLFSSSIMLLCLDELMGVYLGWLGPVTPLGGSLIILAWIMILIQLIKTKRQG